jgi:hypothetical protein
MCSLCLGGCKNDLPALPPATEQKVTMVAETRMISYVAGATSALAEPNVPMETADERGRGSSHAEEDADLETEPLSL